jgi:dihydrolipoamide dehydrogenase
MKIIVIGGGPAGKTAAVEAAQIGEEVTLIEKEYLGGKCLNEGCMVVAGLNDVAKFIKDSHNYNELGITSQPLEVDFEKLSEGMTDTIKKIRSVHEAEADEVGIEVVKGTATVDGDRQSVTVNQEPFKYDKLIVATGASPYIPPIKGAEYAITYQDVLNLKKVPEKLLIIGSGVIATEFASIFSMFGSEVKMLCRDPFLDMLEDDARDYVERKLLDNVEIQRDVQVDEITDNGLYLGGEFIGGEVFLATGLKPNSHILEGIADLGIEREVIVNSKMETSQEHIYAAGDVAGVSTTPLARMEGVVAARNACGIHTNADYSFTPSAISLYYDVAFVTRGEDVGAESSSKYLEGSIPGFAGPGSFWNVLQGNTGFTKVNVDPDSGLVKDISSISPTARTSMAYLCQMMKDGYKTHDFDDFRETHPSTDPVYKLLRFFAKFG